jgi:ectoine hydroxylase-related dioxygenase (phytanoyl-CoA dioxygenase family)
MSNSESPILNTESLAQQGYVKVTNAFTQQEVAAFITALEQVMQDEANNDVCREVVKNNTFVSGVDQLSRQAHPLFLQLNAHPVIQQVLQQIYPEGYTIIQDFAVTKMREAAGQVKWHRDIHPERWDHNYMLGIYLHPSAEEEGALRIIPNSQTSWLDICELQTMPYISLPMQAGDLLIHDMRLAHSSPPLTAWSKRYVIYLEITTPQYATVTYGKTLVESRKLLQQLAEEANRGNYKELTPEHRQSVYPDAFRPLPSLYCFNHLPVNG